MFHFSLFEVVFQPHGLVEHQVVGRGVRVDIEVTDALELQVCEGRHILNELLDVAVVEDV